MKHIILFITITTMFILNSSAALAKNDASKGKGPAAGSGQGGGKTAQVKQSAEKGKDKAVQDVKAAEEKVKAGKEKAQKQVKALKEKGTADAEKAKEQAQKKAQEVKQDKPKAAADEAGDIEKAAGKGQGKEKSAGAKGKPEDKGLGKDQKAAALAKQLQHEDQKHAKRQARLAEMLKVAQDKGDEKAIARIQSLMDKENSRYEKKSTKMAERGTQEKIEKTAAAGDTGDKPASDEPEKTEDAAVEKENE